MDTLTAICSSQTHWWLDESVWQKPSWEAFCFHTQSSSFRLFFRRSEKRFILWNTSLNRLKQSRCCKVYRKWLAYFSSKGFYSLWYQTMLQYQNMETHGAISTYSFENSQWIQWAVNRLCLPSVIFLCQPANKSLLMCRCECSLSALNPYANLTYNCNLISGALMKFSA